HTLRTLSDVDRPEDLPLVTSAGLGAGRDVFLSVIIPALDEAEHVEAAVASAMRDGVEVIVVDGGSSDATADLAARAGARVVTAPPDRGAQMNLGASLAAGTALLFLHADTVLPGRFAEHIFDTLSDPLVIGGAFRHATDMPTAVMKAIAAAVHFRSKHLHLPYGDQGLFVRREAFWAVGGFPSVPVAEDLHFVRRLSCLGRIITLSAPAITSARRWREMGVVRTTAVNLLVLLGSYLDIPPDLLASLYSHRSHRR
ncbi:hypothetical protein LCGC14_2457780, partial [marine sediment metagenome]